MGQVSGTTAINPASTAKGAVQEAVKGVFQESAKMNDIEILLIVLIGVFKIAYFVLQFTKRKPSGHLTGESEESNNSSDSDDG